jgi:GT2 family glycosyltransferase
MDLSIIIINWNSNRFLRNCLSSIRKNAGDLDHEVWVVDNASYDGCGEMLRREFSDVRFIQSETNLGFAKANNLAATQAKGHLLLFLNPDTEVQPEAFRKMAGRLRADQNAGIVGARLLNTDGTLQTSCVQSFPTILNQVLDADILRKLTPRSRLWGMEALFAGGDAPHTVEAVSGAALMIKSGVFQLLDGFSPSYFMYGEDLDLCFRATQAGYQVLHVPDAGITHHGGGSSKSATSSFSVVMMRESVYRFLRKNRGAAYALGYRFGLMAAAFPRMLLSLPPMVMRWSTGGRGSNETLRKWVGILRWSLGLEKWVNNRG